jgi:hypothetical protein
MMRLWLKRNNKPIIHEWNGDDTACLAVQLKGLNLEHYIITGKALIDDHVCCACQIAIAESRGKF